MADSKKGAVIVLLGDLSSHMMVERGSGKNADEAPSYQLRSRDHHEPLLPTMIEHALKDGWPEFKAQMIIRHTDSNDRGMCDKRFSILDRFAQSSKSSKDSPKALRVREDYIVSEESGPGNASGIKSQSDSLFASIKDIQQQLEKHDGQRQHRITVIYDQHGCTRHALDELAQAKQSKRFKNIRDVVGTDDLVLAINSDAEKWASTLKSLSDNILLRKKRPHAGPKRVTIVTTADALRKAGVNIKKYGALEHSIRDIMKAMNQNRVHNQSPVSTFFDYADELVIVFRETGSLHIHKTAKGRCKAALHYCPNFDRIAQSDTRRYGRVPGKFAIFLCAVIKGLYTIANGRKASIGVTSSSADQAIFQGALRLAAVAFNRHFKNGLAYDDPFKSIEQALADPLGNMANDCENATSREDLTCSLELSQEQARRPKKWSRTSEFLARETLESDLREIVINGMDSVLSVTSPSGPKKSTGLYRFEERPWFPRSFITFPYATFGQLKLLDTKEIAEHFELAKIIGKYIQTADWRAPLSIAVFGKPGSGKSFAVNQVLKSVDPARKSEPLTFNLAQFAKEDQLTEAFHQIQDQALASDEVPLAVFDEFDACIGSNKNGWLKYFLAPMQDGLFRGKNGDYRVGRAIFLFSGGTAATFKEFAGPASKKASNDETKLRDFLSRLRGNLNVSDINTNSAKAPEQLKTLRRAALLRTFLQEKAKPIMVECSDGTVRARIHPKVIDAFLHANYVHGVRSMEAIIQMSNWIDGYFVPASLPSKDQLMIHITDKSFLREDPPAKPAKK
ncbi:hypothetical protein [Pseudomonas rubra]|uniref:ATPase AAA-type core domain-containing protein n=1 Tax=Pseudomonas rubra TaxID=2942627 RepID=A0ABT5P361_9PSED|nr:hypothetical protein [Pseudomonas rubra]MDD1012716.1 hypothetical protein [Pseudomonas rubra]MDD1041576.1 hypothetical protein [Pseudomonas rubra]MDD1155512.1 hypothetical protein [Pseudomonas rubra]